MDMQHSIIVLSLKDSFPKDVLPELKGVEVLPFENTAKLFLDMASQNNPFMERGQKTLDLCSRISLLQEKPDSQAAFLRVVSRDVFEEEVRKKLTPVRHTMEEMPGWLDNALQNRQP